MKLGFNLIIAGVITASLSGCATQQLGTYVAHSAPEAATALIRPATQEEKQEKKAGLFVRMLVNPSGQGSIAGMLSISDDQNQVIDLRKYNAVRALPGKYIIRTQCALPSFLITFNVPIEAQAGNEYLLECRGNTAASTYIQIHVIPHKNRADVTQTPIRHQPENTP